MPNVRGWFVFEVFGLATGRLVVDEEPENPQADDREACAQDENEVEAVGDHGQHGKADVLAQTSQPVA